MKDFIVRAITSEGEFRVVAIVMTSVISEVLEGTQHSPELAEALGKAIVGTALIRSAVHPLERFQFHLQNVGKVKDLRVDSWPEGRIRGYVVGHEDPERYDAVTDQVFTVARTRRLAGDEPYQSLLSVVSGNIVQEVERYLQHSAQIEASVSLEVDADPDGRVIWAAGTLVMPLPEANRTDLARLVSTLDQRRALRESFVEGQQSGLVRGMLPPDYPFSIVADEQPVRLCVCSHERILEMFASLGPAQISEIVAEGEPVVVDCAYCPAKRFEVPMVELARLAGELH